MINNLNEALQYFIKEKSKENLDLEVVKSIEDDDNYHSPMCYIIKRKDDNYYFLFYKEGFRTGFEKEFYLPGSGDYDRVTSSHIESEFQPRDTEKLFYK